ncbi:MAG: CASC3 protein CASC3 [Eggerthellaceae bacterium]|nr:CASC3 protein CASC3 [Eggerthellaceae bacterium]
MPEKSGKKHQKVSAKQRAERIKAAEERQARAKAAEERSAKTKKIFTVAVCVILVLALGIPTMALAVLGG